jgi:hypothetical protein
LMESQDMPTSPYTRLSTASGALFILVFSAALFDLGAPPKASDTDAKVASILIHAHGRILHGMYLAGLAIMLGIWFFTTVQRWLAQATHGRETQLANTALAAGLFATALGILGMLLFYGATYKVAGQGGLSAVRAPTDAGNASIELLKFPLATFILAVSLTAHRAALLPRRFTQAGAASALVLIASAIPLFAHGSFTQFGGGLDVIGAAPGIIWIFALSVMMVKGVAAPTTSPALEIHPGERS